MRAVLLAAALAAFYVAGGEPRSGCTDACDRDASGCVDGCESKHGNDAPARVGCKVKCAEQRGACEKACGGK